MKEKEIVEKIGEILLKERKLWRSDPKSREFFGYYIKDKLPEGCRRLWIGYLNYPRSGAKGIFVCAEPTSSRFVSRLAENGFKLFPVWNLWFIKQLISDKNISRLRQIKSPQDAENIIQILLENTYPF
jgi:hypothetical protein